MFGENKDSEEAYQRFPSSPVPVQNKVGPGDTMVVGIVLSVAKRMLLWDATRFGVSTCVAARAELISQELLFGVQNEKVAQKEKNHIHMHSDFTVIARYGIRGIYNILHHEETNIPVVEVSIIDPLY
jgi:hypothetical protein